MQKRNAGSVDLTNGSIPGGILAFTIPLFLGQLLQQFYNMVDAWVIGNFADNNAFAAVSSTGTIVFLIIGFFAGIATGGGVIISRYFGAQDGENVSKAVHTNFLMGLIASIIGTAAGLFPCTASSCVDGYTGFRNAPCSELSPDLFRRRVYGYHVQYLYVHHACPWRQHPSPLLSAVLIHCEYSSGSAFCGTSRLSLGRCRCCCCNRYLSGAQRYSLSVSYVQIEGLYPFGFPKNPLSRMDDETSASSGTSLRHSECSYHRRQPGDSEEYQFLRRLRYVRNGGLLQD